MPTTKTRIRGTVPSLARRSPQQRANRTVYIPGVRGISPYSPVGPAHGDKIRARYREYGKALQRRSRTVTYKSADVLYRANRREKHQPGIRPDHKCGPRSVGLRNLYPRKTTVHRIQKEVRQLVERQLWRRRRNGVQDFRVPGGFSATTISRCQVR